MSGKLDAVTREAVTACVRSPDELDVLLCLARSVSRYTSTRTIADETRLPEDRIIVALEVLASRSLLDVRIAGAVVYKLDPASAAAREAVERTLEAAWRSRAAVLQLVLITS